MRRSARPHGGRASIDVGAILVPPPRHVGVGADERAQVPFRRRQGRCQRSWATCCRQSWSEGPRPRRWRSCPMPSRCPRPALGHLRKRRGSPPRTCGESKPASCRAPQQDRRLPPPRGQVRSTRRRTPKARRPRREERPGRPDATGGTAASQIQPRGRGQPARQNLCRAGGKRQTTWTSHMSVYQSIRALVQRNASAKRRDTKRRNHTGCEAAEMRSATPTAQSQSGRGDA